MAHDNYWDWHDVNVEKDLNVMIREAGLVKYMVHKECFNTIMKAFSADRNVHVLYVDEEVQMFSLHKVWGTCIDWPDNAIFQILHILYWHL